MTARDLRDVPSDIFEKGLRKYCNVNRPIRVVGPVKLDGAVFRKTVKMAGISFTHAVSMRGCRLRGGLLLTDCFFKEGLDLSHATIEEDLKISGKSDQYVEAFEGGLVLDHARISGSLVIESVSIKVEGVAACISAIAAEIGGDCRFSSINLQASLYNPVALKISNLSASTITFDRSMEDEKIADVLRGPKKIKPSNRIFGIVEADGTASASIFKIEHTHASTLNFQSAKAFTLELANVDAGAVNFQNSTCAYLTITNTYCNSDMQLGGVICGCIIRIDGSQGQKFATQPPESTDDLDNNYIRGNLDLWNVTAKVDLHVQSVQVQGMVRLTTARLGRLWFDGNHDAPLRFGAILVENTRIDGDCLIHQVEVEDRKIRDVGGQIRFIGCEIGGDAAFHQVRSYDPAGIRRSSIGWAHLGARTKAARQLRFERNTVGGDLDLTRVLVGDRLALAASDHLTTGGIILDNSKIKGRVRFASPEGILADDRSDAFEKKDVIGLLKAQSRPLQGLPWDYDAVASSLSMNNIEVDKVDLTGLTIRPDPRRPVATGSTVTAAKAPGKGALYTDHVQVDGATVRHDFVLYVRLNGLHRSAHISGALKLNRSSIGTLIVAADTFDSSETHAAADQDGIVLREAKISHLQMPRRAVLGNANGFPVPLDLTDAEIGHWSFDLPGERRDEMDDYERSRDYLDVLDNDHTFSRNVYRSVVRMLRDEGRLNTALRVHYAEHYRAFWEPRDDWRRGAGRLWPPLSTMARSSWGKLRSGWSKLKSLLSWSNRSLSSKSSTEPSVQPADAGIWKSRAVALKHFRAQLSRIVSVPLAAYRFVRHLLRNPIGLPLDWASRTFLRYGASAFPLMACIFFLALVSFFLVASDSRNFELTTANRQLIATQDRRESSSLRTPLGKINLARDARPCDDGDVLGPQPDKWTTLDAVWVVVRYHVPIISLVARDDVVPTDDRGIIPAVRAVAEVLGSRVKGRGPNPRDFWTQTADGYRACPERADGVANVVSASPSKAWWNITPEDWFQLMAILNWIMWPILITALIRRLIVPEK